VLDGVDAEKRILLAIRHGNTRTAAADYCRLTRHARALDAA
jgi:hypothetical protein